MPRTPRIHFDGARHHVMNRTARRRIVFDKPEHLALFERLLGELPGRFGARVHAWALMGNHFHLLLDVPDDRLPALMAWLTGELARKVNGENGWDGPLFRGRYRNRVVLDDTYWHDVLAYVHMNPVRAGLVGHPDESGWTSHRFYAGLAPAPPWLTTAELLALWGGPDTYREEISRLVRGESTLDLLLDASLVWTMADTRGVALSPPKPTVGALSPEEALAQVERLTGSARRDLLTPGRGAPGNLARTLAAWWLHRAAAQRRRTAALLLGTTPGAVGAAVHRVVHAEGQLGGWRDALLLAWWGPLEARPRDEEGDAAAFTD